MVRLYLDELVMETGYTGVMSPGDGTGEDNQKVHHGTGQERIHWTRVYTYMYIHIRTYILKYTRYIIHTCT